MDKLTRDLDNEGNSATPSVKKIFDFFFILLETNSSPGGREGERERDLMKEVKG